MTTLPSPSPVPARISSEVLEPSPNTPSFLLNAANKTYKHQYANIYFVRLRILRDEVERVAKKRWGDTAGKPVLIPSVLDVVKSQLCYIVGTVYMEMPLKPNVLEDIARDPSIPPPPPLSKLHSTDDSVMLEDESGRIRLVGGCIRNALLVTGVIIAALGVETSNGDFEVVDICYAGMAPHANSDDVHESFEEAITRMEVDDSKASSTSPSNTAGEWIAIISGLDIGSPSSSDAQIQMLVEYLAGEQGGPEDQVSASRISRLIIAGDSLAPTVVSEASTNGEDKASRRYGHDSATFSPHPTISLSAHVLDLCRVLPVHLLPGPNDPSGVLLPQQPFPRAMFGAASSLSSFSCETNPTYLRLAVTGSGPDSSRSASKNRQTIARTMFINSGQPLNDMYKYLPSPPVTRLSVLESTLRWRHMAPTAPDTLWCHPYFLEDPFLIKETPDVYIVGGQKKFATRLVVNDGDGIGKEDGTAKSCRIVLVPGFAETGILVLVNLWSLDVKTVRFAVQGMTGGGMDAE